MIIKCKSNQLDLLAVHVHAASDHQVEGQVGIVLELHRLLLADAAHLVHVLGLVGVASWLCEASREGLRYFKRSRACDLVFGGTQAAAPGKGNSEFKRLGSVK